MKKFILMVFISVLIIKAIAQNASPILPYSVAYSSSFEMTNNKYSAVIMNIWKEFGNNNFSNFPGYLADTVQLERLTGVYKGSRDNFISVLSASRGRYKAFDTKMQVSRHFRPVADGLCILHKIFSKEGRIIIRLIGCIVLDFYTG